jgi:hypothetical protein
LSQRSKRRRINLANPIRRKLTVSLSSRHQVKMILFIKSKINSSRKSSKILPYKRMTLKEKLSRNTQTNKERTSEKGNKLPRKALFI